MQIYSEIVCDKMSILGALLSAGEVAGKLKKGKHKVDGGMSSIENEFVRNDF